MDHLTRKSVARTAKTRAWPRLRDLPESERADFSVWLRGRTAPIIEGESDQDGYYLEDYQHWKRTKVTPTATGLCLNLTELKELEAKLSAPPSDALRRFMATPSTVSDELEKILLERHPPEEQAELDELWSAGRRLFSSDEDFKKWLSTPAALWAGGKTPASMIKTKKGRAEVIGALNGLAYGNLL